MSNIIPFKPAKSSSKRKRLQDAAETLIHECEASGRAFSIFKRKFLKDADDSERFTLGMALFHEGISQIIASQNSEIGGFSDEDLRCLVSMVVDSLLSEASDIQ